MLPIFFDFFENSHRPKVGVGRPVMESRSCCKNLSQNGAPSEKLCPFYWRYLKLWFWRGTNRQIARRRLGQDFPGICSDRMRKMNTRGAAMQGDEHKAARNLSRACTARVHARRLARASRVVWWHDLWSGNGGWDSGGNKTRQRAIELRRWTQPKPATRLDHGHKLNKANLETKLQRLTKGCRTAEFFCGYFLEL